MLDLGFDKLALIGAVALIVIGPEKLPRVARTVGHLVGKAQRYVRDVKDEVNRTIELEEIKKAKAQFESAARSFESDLQGQMAQTHQTMKSMWEDSDSASSSNPGHSDDPSDYFPITANASYSPPRKNWRVKRTAVPRWYKQQQRVRLHVQSGAARVARFRPHRSS